MRPPFPNGAHTPSASADNLEDDAHYPCELLGKEQYAKPFLEPTLLCGHPGGHANIIIPNSLPLMYLAPDAGQIPTSPVLASKWEYPLPHDTSFSTHLDRLPTDRLISASPLHAPLPLEPNKSFIYNQLPLVAD